jgi:hypothetical protein
MTSFITNQISVCSSKIFIKKLVDDDDNSKLKRECDTLYNNLSQKINSLSNKQKQSYKNSYNQPNSQSLFPRVCNLVFEVLTMVVLKSTILWHIMLCSPLKGKWHYKNSYNQPNSQSLFPRVCSPFFEVLTMVVVKSTILWHIMLCSQLKGNWHFGRMYCLHLQVWRINGARNQCESRWQTEPLLLNEFHSWRRQYYGKGPKI